MSKILECGAVVPGCKFVIHGESDEDVMMKASEHARAVHGSTICPSNSGRRSGTP